MADSHYYIGIMSGTSADGVDLALVDFSCTAPQLITHFYLEYNDHLHHKITSLYTPSEHEIDRTGTLDKELAQFFANAVNQLLKQEKLTFENIQAIACHGQTIRHRPTRNDDISQPFTLQIGCNQTLACLTNIRVIGDFRTKDIALGGQGAPLVPAFHRSLFSKSQQDTFIVNMGGIANITFLPGNKAHDVLGFDTGPANALLDEWCLTHTGNRFDEDGKWASQGIVNHYLLEQLLLDPYFALPAPKSSGREYFNLNWLAPYLVNQSISPVDVQATLTALTAYSIAQEINKLSPKGFVYLSGGGIDNKACYKLLEQQLNQHKIDSIYSLNLNNKAFEAMAFAWLGYAYDKKIYGNIPAVTGASKPAILGVPFSP